jgi:proteic killer suppression protein
MIKSFRHRGLKELFEGGMSKRVDQRLHARIIRRLDRIDIALDLAEINVPGFDFHPLRGKPQRYSVHVNGPWCITFGWDGENATEVDLEQYH